MKKKFFWVIILIIIIVIIILFLLKFCNTPKFTNVTTEIEQVDPFKIQNTAEFMINLSTSSVEPGRIEGTLFIVPNNLDSITDIKPENFIANIFIEDSSIYKLGTKDLFVNASSTTKSKIATSLVLDFSGSMYMLYTINDYNQGVNVEIIPINELISAVQNFISFFKAEDIAEIIKFGSDYDPSSGFSNDKSFLSEFVSQNSFNRGSTALYNSIMYAINNMKQIDKNTFIRSVIAFADGQNNQPGYTTDELINEAIINNIPIFSVCFESVEGDCKALEEISLNSGGLSIVSSDPQSLKDLYNKINYSIRNSYYVKISYPQEIFNKYKGTAKMKIRIIKGSKVLGEYVRYL
ncbi:MAG: VWA domain-containing protein [Candidatus Kapabacteria bacterium]|nr:VWA domain-containing protein [Candidatus Kapabacteria bacterium]